MKKRLSDLYFRKVDNISFYDMDEVNPQKFTAFCDGMDISYANSDDIFGIFHLLPNELCLANKLHPHSLYDMMIITTRKENSLSLDDLSLKEKRTLMNTCVDFYRFVFDKSNIRLFELNGGYPYVVFNCDLGKNDRKSGMSIKRFHMHLNCWRREDIFAIEKKRNNTLKMNDLLYRRIIDPITQLGYKIVIDSVKEINTGEVDICECGNLHFLNESVIRIIGGIKALSDDRFIGFMDRLHNLIEEKYHLCKDAFVRKTYHRQEWQREELLDKSEIVNNIEKLPFTDEIKTKLAILADVLNNVSEKEMTLMKRNKFLSSNFLLLEDLFYSIAFYQDGYIEINENNIERPIYMIVKVSLISDIGGAGAMSFPTAPLTMIRRNKTIMNDKDQYSRFKFQYYFTKYLEGKQGNV